MSVHVIYYQDGAKRMRPILSREEYMLLRGSRKQKSMLAAVRAGDEEKKMKLLQMNYSCLPNEDGTLKGSTRMSTSVGMDIDHIGADEMEAVKENILGKKDELGLLMLERSARGQGYHLVFRRRQELSQEDNLRWASELLGVEFDSGAKDITRVFFTTTDGEEDLLFLDDGIFENGELREKWTVDSGQWGGSRLIADELLERVRTANWRNVKRALQRYSVTVQNLPIAILRSTRGLPIRILSRSTGSCSMTGRSPRRATGTR